ncbi:hypothetical protein [Hymenobacter glacialis]|nr:hypothetical protein [Hymenobacter glacialis]
MVRIVNTNGKNLLLNYHPSSAYNCTWISKVTVMVNSRTIIMQ